MRKIERENKQTERERKNQILQREGGKGSLEFYKKCVRATSKASGCVCEDEREGETKNPDSFIDKTAEAK